MKLKKCRYCKSIKNLTKDHKIPKIQGGSDKESNLQCLCFTCNSMKSGLSHKQVMRLFQWFLRIQEARILAGKTPYKLKDKK